MKLSAFSTHPFPHSNFHSFFPCSLSIRLNHVLISSFPFQSPTHFFEVPISLISLPEHPYELQIPAWIPEFCGAIKDLAAPGLSVWKETSRTHIALGNAMCNSLAARNTSDQTSRRLTWHLMDLDVFSWFSELLFFPPFWLIAAWRGCKSSLVTSMQICPSPEEGHAMGVKPSFFHKSRGPLIIQEEHWSSVCSFPKVEANSTPKIRDPPSWENMAGTSEPRNSFLPPWYLTVPFTWIGFKLYQISLCILPGALLGCVEGVCGVQQAVAQVKQHSEQHSQNLHLISSRWAPCWPGRIV